MRAEEIHIGKLFTAGNQLKIPLWQRHYSWEKVHWTELWTDLQRVAGGEQPEHFVGSIVLKQLPWSGLPSEAHRYWVVDGQQRIATLTLIMCAIRDRIALLAADADSRREIQDLYTSQLLINTNLATDHRSRLVLQEHDRASMDPLVNGTWAGQVVTRIEAAYAFFREQLTAYDTVALERLMSIAQTKLSAVWVTLQDEDNAHRVFQTLNAGGKKLEQSDLVRNYFFLLLGDAGDQFYASSWRSMETELGEKEIEAYFIAWTISQGHAGSADSLFSYFQRDLRSYETSLDDVLEYGTSLVDTARLFRFMRTPQDGGYSQATTRTLVDLRNWGTVPADGLILFLLRAERDGVISDTELCMALEVVLSFMARRQLAGYEPNLHRGIFTTAARRLRAAKQSGSDLVDYLRYLMSDGDDLKSWPGDEEIRANARTTSVYSRTRSGWAFLVLERIERGLYSNPKFAQENLPRSKYSVEHVLPQTLTDVWISDLATWGQTDAHQLHETRLHVLGNLTLTPINSELGNKPFASKREQLLDDPMRLNQKIASADSWTQARIDERSSALALIACAQFAAPWSGVDLIAAKERFERAANTAVAPEPGADDGEGDVVDADPDVDEVDD